MTGSVDNCRGGCLSPANDGRSIGIGAGCVTGSWRERDGRCHCVSGTRVRDEETNHPASADDSGCSRRRAADCGWSKSDQWGRCVVSATGRDLISRHLTGNVRRCGRDSRRARLTVSRTIDHWSKSSHGAVCRNSALNHNLAVCREVNIATESRDTRKSHHCFPSVDNSNIARGIGKDIVNTQIELVARCSDSTGSCIEYDRLSHDIDGRISVIHGVGSLKRNGSTDGLGQNQAGGDVPFRSFQEDASTGIGAAGGSINIEGIHGIAGRDVDIPVGCFDRIPTGWASSFTEGDRIEFCDCDSRSGLGRQQVQPRSQFDVLDSRNPGIGCRHVDAQSQRIV